MANNLYKRSTIKLFLDRSELWLSTDQVEKLQLNNQ